MPTIKEIVGEQLTEISAAALQAGAQNFYLQQQNKLEFQRKLVEKKQKKRKKR